MPFKTNKFTDLGVIYITYIYILLYLVLLFLKKKVYTNTRTCFLWQFSFVRLKYIISVFLNDELNFIQNFLKKKPMSHEKLKLVIWTDHKWLGFFISKNVFKGKNKTRTMYFSFRSTVYSILFMTACLTISFIKKSK